MAEGQDYRGVKRTIDVKLDYTRKQLVKAIKDGDEEKIHKLEQNIKVYEDELKKLKKGCI